MPKVLNRRDLGHIPPNAVYVGRPSKWGNPFAIGEHGDREEVIAKYRTRLLGSPRLLSQLDEIKGKDLVCFCAPLLCHADVLLYYANEET